MFSPGDGVSGLCAFTAAFGFPVAQPDSNIISNSIEKQTRTMGYLRVIVNDFATIACNLAQIQFDRSGQRPAPLNPAKGKLGRLARREAHQSINTAAA